MVTRISPAANGSTPGTNTGSCVRDGVPTTAHVESGVALPPRASAWRLSSIAVMLDLLGDRLKLKFAREGLPAAPDK
jgi:hypothetical protein